MFRESSLTAVALCVVLLCANVSASPLSPGIFGTFYNDINMDGQVSVGESIEGLSLQLFRDNGDGIFNPINGDVAVGGVVTTGAMGEYGFADLPDAGYFIRQGATPGFLQSVTPLIRPADVDLLIDDFLSETTLDGSSVDPNETASSPHDPDNSPLSGMRHVEVGLLSGVGNTRVLINPYGLDSKLIYSTSAGVTGQAEVTWDFAASGGNGNGVSSLAPIDLTENGKSSGLMLRVGVDQAGANDVLKVRLLGLNEGDVSEAEFIVPATDGFLTEFVFVPFSDFTGPVDPTETLGVQVEIGNGSASVDASIDVFGVIGPKVQNVAVAISVPEPTSLFLLSLGTLITVEFVRRRRRTGRV